MAEVQSSIKNQIRICFNLQDGTRDYFRCNEHIKVQNFVQAFCIKRQMDYKTLVFLFQGKPLPYAGTITQAGLADQDEIDVMITQTGGGGALYTSLSADQMYNDTKDPHSQI